MANLYNLEQRLKYRKSGIYTVTNLINGKMYVGYALNLTDRKSNHLRSLANGNHRNPYLQKAANKYGVENFIFEVLEECAEEYLTALEHYWCNMLCTHNDKYGYNILPTHPYTGRNSGYKRPLSEESKKSRKEKYVFTPALEAACRESIKLAQASMRGVKRKKEHILSLIKSRTGSNKQIEVLNIDGSFFGLYDLIKEASEATKTSTASIFNNISGRTKSTVNYVFKYKLI